MPAVVASRLVSHDPLFARSIWNRLLNVVEVLAVPPFATDAEKVTAVPFVSEPEARAGVPVVRSMVAEAVTVTVALAAGDVPPAPVQVIVYVVLVVGETATEPEVAVPAVKLLVHDVAFVEDQVRVELEPLAIEVGDAERFAVGAGEPADTVTVLVTVL